MQITNMHSTYTKSALVPASPYEPVAGLFFLVTDIAAPQQPLMAQFGCLMQRIEHTLVAIDFEFIKKAPHGGFSRFTYLMA